ncbi:MAG TPA: YCF48-related protein, partial [Puia sp.]|nr:YCF48-related protein [Puia sp.]
GGQSWQDLMITLNNDLYAICFLNKEIGFAGGQNGVLIRTADGGSTWSLVRTGLHFNISSIRFFGMDQGVIVSEYGEIATTTDGGLTWQKECPGGNGVFSLQKVAIRDPKTVFAVQNGSIFQYDITP